MCSKEETVLSDVHIAACHSRPPSVVNDIQLSQHFNNLPYLKIVQTRFEFNTEKPSKQGNGYSVKLTSAMQETGNSCTQAAVEASAFDEDGDLLNPHSELCFKDVIIIDHFLATPLHLVGLQVWLGSLLLADYFLHAGRTILKNARVIELGAGTGLCSLVAAIFAEAVLLTDYDEGILELCHRNIQQNKNVINSEVKVRKLDWCAGLDSQYAQDSRWQLDHNENLLANLNTAFAADVIYRDELTDALFRTLDELMTRGVKKFYLAIEKRLNFTVKDLDVVCPAYNYFLACIKRYNFSAQQVEKNFPQRLKYERSAQLELWILRKEKETSLV